MDAVIAWIALEGRPAFEVFLSFVCGAVVVVSGRMLWRHLCFAHKTKWWDQSKIGPFAKLDWHDVNELMQTDPVTFSPKFRRSGWVWSVLLIFVYFGISLISARLLWVYAPSIPVERIETLAKSFGAISVVVAALGYFLQARVTTRSQNRQEWIKQIREALDPLISCAPSWEVLSKEENDEVRPKQSTDFFVKHHARLELLLNPSEKEHRALLALLRQIHGMERIALDDAAWKGLRLAEQNPLKKGDWEAIKSQIIRLSNVVLKREWEQVKHVR